MSTEPAPRGDIVILLAKPYLPDARVHKEGTSLIAAGYRVRVLAWDREWDQPTEPFDDDGIRIEHVRGRWHSPPRQGGRQLFKLPSYWLRAARAIAAELRPRTVVACNDLDTLPVGFWLHRLWGIPFVYEAREGYAEMMSVRFPRPVTTAMDVAEKALVRSAQAVITASTVVADDLGRHFRGPVTTVGNYARLEDFPEQPAARVAQVRRRIGVPDGDYLLTYIGRFDDNKVLLPFVDFVEELSGVTLALVGYGAQEEALRARVRRGVRTRLVGRIPLAEVPLYTAASDVLLYCLVSSSYNAPNALANALAAGRPLLASDSGDLGRIVRERRCGLLLDGIEREPVLAHLRRLRDADLRRELGRNARRAAEEQYHWQRAAEQLVRVYGQALGGAVVSARGRIGILGYYGAGNLGDEAILESILGTLERLGARGRALVFSADPAHTEASHGVEALPARLHRRPGAFFATARALRELDALLVGGGGLFHDYYPRVVPFYAAWVAWARALRVPVAVYGVGVGPLWRGRSRWLLRHVYRWAELFVVRDARSYEWTRRIAADQDHLVLGGDPVFLHPELDSDRGDAAAADGGIALSLRPWPFRGGRGARAPERQSAAAWTAALASFADAAAELTGGPIVLLELQPGQDDRLAESVREQMEHGDRVRAVTVHDVHAAVEQTRRCALVCCMRLHALLIASLAGAPAMPLVYDEKVDSLATGLGVRGWGLRVEELGAPAARDALERAWTERLQLRAAATQRIEHARAVARSGEAELVGWLNGLGGHGGDEDR